VTSLTPRIGTDSSVAVNTTRLGTNGKLPLLVRYPLLCIGWMETHLVIFLLLGWVIVSDARKGMFRKLGGFRQRWLHSIANPATALGIVRLVTMMRRWIGTGAPLTFLGGRMEEVSAPTAGTTPKESIATSVVLASIDLTGKSGMRRTFVNAVDAPHPTILILGTVRRALGGANVARTSLSPTAPNVPLATMTIQHANPASVT